MVCLLYRRDLGKWAAVAGVRYKGSRPPAGARVGQRQQWQQHGVQGVHGVLPPPAQPRPRLPPPWPGIPLPRQTGN